MTAFILLLAFFSPSGELVNTTDLMTFDNAESCYKATQPALQAVIFGLDKKSFESVKRGDVILRTVCTQGDKS